MNKLLLLGVVFLFSIIAVNAEPIVYLSANGMNIGERVTYDLQANKKYNFYAWGNNEVDEVFLYVKGTEVECKRGKTCGLEYIPKEVGKQIQLDVIGYKQGSRVASQKFYIDLIKGEDDIGEKGDEDLDSDVEDDKNVIENVIENPQKSFSIDYCNQKQKNEEIGQVLLGNGYNFIFDFSEESSYEDARKKVKTLKPSLYYYFWEEGESYKLDLFYYKRYEQIDLLMNQFPDMIDFFSGEVVTCDSLYKSYVFANEYFNTLNEKKVKSVNDYDENANFRVLIIPLAWEDNSYEDFQANSKVIGSKLTKALGFDTCTDKISIVTPTKKEFEESFGNWYCEVEVSSICSEEVREQNYRYFTKEDEMEKLIACHKKFISKNEFQFDRIVGLIPNNVDPGAKSCETAGNEIIGYTYPFYDYVIGTPISIVHEIGHTFGFKDQYKTSEFYSNFRHEDESKSFVFASHFEENPDLYMNNRVENKGKDFIEIGGSHREDTLNPFNSNLGCNGGLDLSCVNFINMKQGDFWSNKPGVIHVKGNYDRTGLERTAMAHGTSHFDENEFERIEELLSCNKKFELENFEKFEKKVKEGRTELLKKLGGVQNE